MDWVRNHIAKLLDAHKHRNDGEEEEERAIERSMPEKYKKRLVLDYFGQLEYLTIGNPYSAIAIVFLAIIFGFVLLLVGGQLYSYWPDLIFIILVDLALGCMLLYAGYLTLYRKVDIPALYMAIPTFFGGRRSTSFVMKEGSGVVIPWFFDHVKVRVKIVNINDSALSVPIAGGAYVDVFYSFSMRPILKLLKEFLDAGGLAEEDTGKKGIVDRLDDMIEAAIRKVFKHRSLDEVQGLEDELISAVTEEFLKDVAGEFLAATENHRITPVNPAFLYPLATELFNFNITHVEATAEVKAAQTKVMKEVWERYSELLDLLTRIKKVTFQIKFLKGMGSKFNAYNMLNAELEAGAIQGGAKTIPGAQALLTSLATMISGETLSVEDLDGKIDEWANMDAESLVKEFESMQDVLKALGGQKTGGKKTGGKK